MPNVIFRPPPPPSAGENFVSGLAGGAAQGLQESNKATIANNLMMRQAAIHERLQQIQADREQGQKKELMGAEYGYRGQEAERAQKAKLGEITATGDEARKTKESQRRSALGDITGLPTTPFERPGFEVSEADKARFDQMDRERMAAAERAYATRVQQQGGGVTSEGYTLGRPMQTQAPRFTSDRAKAAFASHLVQFPEDYAGAHEAANTVLEQEFGQKTALAQGNADLNQKKYELSKDLAQALISGRITQEQHTQYTDAIKDAANVGNLESIWNFITTGKTLTTQRKEEAGKILTGGRPNPTQTGYPPGTPSATGPGGKKIYYVNGAWTN